ncbi:hypothetical protein HAHE_37990 [Haloferula helveola]|uniref:HupE / UreJ protein n=1 Tax=Haloferula helveola TaxID=490095 RepID=A0ABN6H888_9BACT|nr:hypothetical protein HAHE_37990 [Haloferula helveola]
MWSRLIAISLLLAGLLRAHQIDEITIELEIGPGRWTATLQADAAYMLPEYRGDSDIAPFDLAWLRTRTPEEWTRIREETRKYLRETLGIRDGSYEISFPDFETSPPRFVQEGIAEMLPNLTVVLEGDIAAAGLDINWNEPFDVVLILINEGESFPLVSGESIRFEPQRKPRSFTRWIQLGFRHILPDGLDHILFILGIFLLKPKWRPLLAQSLVFTLTHSLTLALAALGWVNLPASVVEPAIALSIVWIAIENLRPKEIGLGRYLTIAAFGLVHGLGFARILSDALPDAAHPFLPLVGFNLGVELGQITILVAGLAIAGWWKEERFAKLRLGGSILIALVAAFWFVERLLDRPGSDRADRAILDLELAVAASRE